MISLLSNERSWTCNTHWSCSPNLNFLSHNTSRVLMIISGAFLYDVTSKEKRDVKLIRCKWELRQFITWRVTMNVSQTNFCRSFNEFCTLDTVLCNHWKIHSINYLRVFIWNSDLGRPWYPSFWCYVASILLPKFWYSSLKTTCM